MEKKIEHEIKKVNNMIERVICDIHKNDEHIILTSTQVQILYYLYKNKSAYQNELEDLLDVRRSTISGILKTMEKNNLIKRIKKDDDARINKITLTDECFRKATQMKDRILLYESKLMNNISEEELDVFFTVIDKIKNNINNWEDD